VEWARVNPALALCLFTPLYCLMNSKLIVCACSKMNAEAYSIELILFSAFSINEAFMNYDEWKIASWILVIHSLRYLEFVFCTIDQITQYLDIYCLSIKPAVSTKPTSKTS